MFLIVFTIRLVWGRVVQVQGFLYGNSKMLSLLLPSNCHSLTKKNNNNIYINKHDIDFLGLKEFFRLPTKVV
jgi:hypothetical protein